eukprot:scaffold385712_cov106-Cyclotella_meneghiniana.AAC.1
MKSGAKSGRGISDKDKANGVNTFEEKASTVISPCLNYLAQLTTFYQDRASFDPKSTSDTLFEGVDVENDGGDAAAIPGADDEADAAAFHGDSNWDGDERRSSVKKNKKKKGGGTAPAHSSVDRQLLRYLDKLDKSVDKEKSAVEKHVELAAQFKSMKDSLGGPIKAAYAMKEFEQFLDRDERRELKRYAATQAAPSSEEEEEEYDGLKE